jgi:hypothetical protein
MSQAINEQMGRFQQNAVTDSGHWRETGTEWIQSPTRKLSPHCSYHYQDGHNDGVRHQTSLVNRRHKDEFPEERCWLGHNTGLHLLC